ncbi:MAG TPA: hypothetical protein VI434_07080 [Candidatus Dormibacteraeota bacterium]
MPDAQEYLATVSERLVEDEFEVRPNVSVGGEVAGLWAERRNFQPGLFSTVSTFVVIRLDTAIDAAHVTAFSSACFEAAADRTGGGRGLGSSGVCFAVTVIPHADPSVISAVESTAPTKHWSSFEFPVLVDLGASTVSFYRQRVLWGAGYVGKFRRDAERWLQPTP